MKTYAIFSLLKMCSAENKIQINNNSRSMNIFVCECVGVGVGDKDCQMNSKHMQINLATAIQQYWEKSIQFVHEKCKMILKNEFFLF